MNTQDNRFLQQIGNAKAKAGDVLARALFGEEIAQPETTVVNNDGVYSIESGVNNGGRKGGLLSFINDARNGMLENSSQGFQASNLYPDREKGAGFRLGEAAGSALRLLDNPIARGAIAYGLSKRMGDENPLGEALTAAISTQQNKMKDRMYRQALAGRNIDTSDIRGWLGDDTFKYLLEDQQVRDNAAYRNALLQSNLMNQREMMEYRKQEADRQARQDAIDTDIAYKNLGLKEKELEQKGNNVKPLSDSQVEKINTAQDTLEALENIESRYSNPKYKNAFGLSGAARTQFAKDHPLLYAPFDNEITLVRQDIDMLRQKYAKAMEGGRMSDSDRAFYQNVLMSQNLSYENFLEGVKRLKASEQKSLERRIANYGLQGKDVSEFEKYTSQAQSQAPNVNNDKSLIVEKLRAKGYSENDIAEYLKMKGL